MSVCLGYCLKITSCLYTGRMLNRQEIMSMQTGHYKRLLTVINKISLSRIKHRITPINSRNNYNKTILVVNNLLVSNRILILIIIIISQTRINNLTNSTTLTIPLGIFCKLQIHLIMTIWIIQDKIIVIEVINLKMHHNGSIHKQHHQIIKLLRNNLSMRVKRIQILSNYICKLVTTQKV